MIALTLGLVLLAAPDFKALAGEFDIARQASNWRKVNEVVDTIKDLRDARVTPWLLNEFRLAGEEKLKRALFAALANRRGNHRKGFVMEHLGSGDPYVRAIAVEALGEIDIGRATKRAAELLEVDDDRRVRRSAALVLLKVKSDEALREYIRAAAKVPVHEQGPLIGMLATVETDRLVRIKDMAGPGIPAEQLIALIVVARRGDAQFADVLREATKSKTRQVALIAAAGLAKLAGDDKAHSLNRLLRAKSLDEKWDLYDLMARAGLREQVFVTALTKAVRSGDKRIRAKAAEALGAVGGDRAVSVLAPLLRQKTPWQLPVGAARGLGLTRSREAIEPLIDALAFTKARLNHEVVKALESLTGQPFGRQDEVWRRWWSSRQKSFNVPAVEPALWVEETDAENEYAFYGIQLVSERVAFVCDISGSMAGTSIQTMQRELHNVVKRFPPHGKFNFVFFNEKVHAWKKKLVTASDSSKKSAFKQIDALKAVGATNLWDALEMALKDKTVDTIVMLSDGAPTAGKLKNLKKIAQTFVKINRERMVTLHVVAIGQSSPFLSYMAKLSGGNYVEK